MYITEAEYKKMRSILQEIRTEAQREKIRKNRLVNLSGRVRLVLTKAERRDNKQNS